MTEKQKQNKLRQIWKNMRQRCLNKNNPGYRNYGGRGIKISKEWDKFNNFWSDMGWNYRPGLSIERIDNNKGYSYENCIWTTAKKQNNNRRSNVLVSINGETKTIQEWCDDLNIDRSLVSSRLKIGWKLEDAIFTPFEKHKWNPLFKSFNLYEFYRENDSIISYGTLLRRVNMGIPPKEAIKLPPKRRTKLSTRLNRTACKI